MIKNQNENPTNLKSVKINSASTTISINSIGHSILTNSTHNWNNDNNQIQKL